MSVRSALIGGSLLAHAGLVVALGGIEAPRSIAATAIEVVETSKPEPTPPVTPEPPPPEPAVQPAPPRARAAKAAPAEPPPEVPPAAATAPPLGALPDFGLELGNGAGGLAVPAAAPLAPRAPATTTTKALEKAPAPARAVDACDEPPAKPKLVNLPQPAYTDAARAANVEGKVRIEITVDEAGKVVSVRALTSLGHGLDEAALSAARSATFEPAMRCGRPGRSTFTVSIRFTAS